MIINEASRLDIINRSKQMNQLNRYASRLEVKNVSLSRVGILELAYLDQPNLDIYFEINDNYKVSLRLVDFMNNLRNMYSINLSKIQDELKTKAALQSKKLTESKVLRKVVEMALKNSLDSKDIQVSCTCPDWEYRFDYVASINDYKFGNLQLAPAKVRNPENLGGACKHVIAVLSRPSKWEQKVITGVMSVIRKNPGVLDPVQF